MNDRVGKTLRESIRTLLDVTVNDVRLWWEILDVNGYSRTLGPNATENDLLAEFPAARSSDLDELAEYDSEALPPASVTDPEYQEGDETRPVLVHRFGTQHWAVAVAVVDFEAMEE